MIPDEPVFREPWEAQAFAMTVLLHQRGLFTWAEWAQTLGAQIAGAQQAISTALTTPDANATANANTALDASAVLGANTALVANRAPDANAAPSANAVPSANTAPDANAVLRANTAIDADSAPGVNAAPERPYYQHWLAALQTIVAAKGASSPEELMRFQRAWQHAAHRTPHGHAIDLQSQDLDD